MTTPDMPQLGVTSGKAIDGCGHVLGRCVRG